jgi:hypothetical protein
MWSSRFLLFSPVSPLYAFVRFRALAHVITARLARIVRSMLGRGRGLVLEIRRRPEKKKNGLLRVFVYAACTTRMNKNVCNAMRLVVFGLPSASERHNQGSGVKAFVYFYGLT